MRKIVAHTLMGMDGAVDDPPLYFQPSDRPDEPFVFDDESEAFELATVATQDAVLLGRTTWDEWRRFWPGVPSPFGDFINRATKYVVTSRPLDEDWSPSTPVSGRLDLVVAELAQQPGADVGVHGSIRLLQSLLEADLVDELRLIAGPVAGTPGRRLFEGLSGPRRFALRSAVPTSTGNLLLSYGRW